MKYIFSLILAFILTIPNHVNADVDLQVSQSFVNGSSTTYTAQIRTTSGTVGLGTGLVLWANSNTTNITGLNGSITRLGNFNNGNYVIANLTYSSGNLQFNINYSGGAGNGASVTTSYQDLFSVTFDHNNSGTNNITWNTATTGFLTDAGGSITNGTMNGLTGSQLPVTLSKFNSKLLDNVVVLNWATATEINNDKFEVERSINGIEFVKVGEVKGNGNSTKLNNYTFTDHSASAVSSNKLFYRLKQNDFNGDFEYSNITLVKKNNLNADVKVFPNPANIKVTVDINNPDALSSKIEVLGLDGKAYLTLLTERNSEDLDISHLGQGIYLVKVTAADDTQTIQKLIIQ